MPSAEPALSPAIRAALAAFAEVAPDVVHGRQVALARLVLDQAPPDATGQLQLAAGFIAGHCSAEQLRDARQDCWTYVGSLACGCSVSDSASAHAIMTCLETDAAAHSPASLAEQALRVLRCDVAEASVLDVLLG